VHRSSNCSTLASVNVIDDTIERLSYDFESIFLCFLEKWHLNFLVTVLISLGDAPINRSHYVRF
jgi:hypothetical protein